MCAMPPWSRSTRTRAISGSWWAAPTTLTPRIDGAVNVPLMPRQPGSAIKPITYAAAFGRGYTPATMLLDVRTAFVTREGDAYVPINYDRAITGPVLLRQALASSLNMIAVKVLDHIGVADAGLPGAETGHHHACRIRSGSGWR